MLPTATKATTMQSLTTFKAWLNLTSNKTKAISSLTSVGLVATAVCANHGYATNTFVRVAGTSPDGYNGWFLITVVDADTFTFPLPATVTSPAAGTPTVTIDDARYALMADAATQEFEHELDVLFVRRSVTEVFSGTGKIAYALSYSPVASIDTFTMDGAAVDPSSYVFDPDTGIITFTGGGTFSCGIKNVAVGYTTGYDVQDGPALPADVYRASLDLAKAIHDELVSNAIAATSVSLGPSSMVIKAAKRPESVQRVFDIWEGKGYRP